MIVEAVGEIHVKITDALNRLANYKTSPPIERRITQVRVVKKRADGTIIEEVTIGDYK